MKEKARESIAWNVACSAAQNTARNKARNVARNCAANAARNAAQDHAAEVAPFKLTLTPFAFPSFPFPLMKVAAFQLVMLCFMLLGYAQIGTGAWPRIVAECMTFLRGSGLLPINKN